jgi:hypothetical protein
MPRDISVVEWVEGIDSCGPDQANTGLISPQLLAPIGVFPRNAQNKPQLADENPRKNEGLRKPRKRSPLSNQEKSTVFRLVNAFQVETFRKPQISQGFSPTPTVPISENPKKTVWC